MRTRDGVVAALVFAGSFAAFWVTPNHPMCDSQYTLLLSDNLVTHHDFWLERYQIPDEYRLERVGGHQYYWYPPGSSVLSIPYVIAMRRLGVRPVRADGSYSSDADGYLNAQLACIVAAGLVALMFVTARLLLPLPWALALALVAGFGTQVHSTASRSLGADTWGTLLLGALAFLLLRAETRGRR